MTELTITELIELLSRNPGWRFFDKYGCEFTYDRDKALFEYHGWDDYNDCPDTIIRHLRTPRKLRKRIDADYMFARATVDGKVLRLWSSQELDSGWDPELTLHVLREVDIEDAARPAPGAVSVSRNESPAAPVIYSGISAYHLVWAGNMLDCGYVLTATHSSGTVTEKFRWSHT